MEARSNHADINKIAKRYDWTFTPSNYKGCLLSEENSDSLKVGVTDEKIDYERLKIQEKIVYFDEIILYEDELDDNGIAKLSIKIVSSQKFYIYYIPCEPAMLSRRKLSGDPPETKFSFIFENFVWICQ